MRGQVLMAMSGGVDSSVAAAFLVEQGYNVIGVTMKLWQGEDDPFAAHRFGGCCTVGSSEDARRVAHQLNIPYYVLNLQEEFHQAVVDNFVEEYAAGRTPNPCARCNEFIKFRAFLERADELGCDYIATGHYARVEHEPGRSRLRRGLDARKDQSYVLGMLTQKELSRVLLPIGSIEKTETRERAGKLGMAVATKPDSQEICFVEDNDYFKFVSQRVPSLADPGPIVDGSGKVLGQHLGLGRYTVGQRKGLGIASAEPLFVTEIDAANNTLKVGGRAGLSRQGLEATGATWTFQIPQPGTLVEAQMRAHSVPVACEVVRADEEGFEVRFLTPAGGPTPGQMCVLYAGDEVLGAGTIT